MTFQYESQTSNHDDTAENDRHMPIKIKRKVVGYIRVSSTEQEKKGMSLDGQADLLRDHARRQGWDLIDIYEDPQSAYSRGSESRPGLRAAIARAIAKDGFILIVTIDRLSRNHSVLKSLDIRGLSVLSVREGRVGKKRLRSLIASAEKQSAEISRRSKESAARKRTLGKKLGNRINLGDAQRRGAINNAVRSGQKNSDLADVIAAHPDLTALTWAGRAAALNAAGHYNMISEKNGTRKDWTMGSLRKPF